MQIKNSFDKESVKKIAKGALYAMGVPAALGLLDYIGTLQFSDQTLTLLVAYLVPVLISAIKEYKSGN